MRARDNGPLLPHHLLQEAESKRGPELQKSETFPKVVCNGNAKDRQPTTPACGSYDIGGEVRLPWM